jgi:Stress responsive A/B Barrel Domain
MIRHIVLIRFRPDVSDEKIVGMFEALPRIRALLDGVLSITAGKSESPEQIERGYMHGFVIDFRDWDALAAYQAHPDHQRFGGQLVAHAIGGLDGILVFDLPAMET